MDKVSSHPGGLVPEKPVDAEVILAPSAVRVDPEASKVLDQTKHEGFNVLLMTPEAGLFLLWSSRAGFIIKWGSFRER